MNSGALSTTPLYTQNVIDFIDLTTNQVFFSFYNLPVHQRLIVRAKVYTECSSDNATVVMTLPGTTP